jgi:hypothetical protein
MNEICKILLIENRSNKGQVATTKVDVDERNLQTFVKERRGHGNRR